MITPTGDIKDLTIPWLFQDLRINKLTGTVTFSLDKDVKKAYLKDGDIIFASSNRDEDRLGEYLLKKGKISREQFDKCSEIVVKTGKKLGAVLFELKVISAHDLVAEVKLQVREILLHLFTWRDGKYAVDKGNLPVSDIIPLQMSTGDIIISGVRELDWKGVRKSLPPLSAVLRPTTDPKLLFQSAHLDADQRTVLDLIDGRKTIQDICLQSGIGDFNTLKALYVLIALRMVEQGQIKAEEAPTVKAEAEAAPVVVTKEMIQRAFEQVDSQDYYEVLDIGRGATPQEIKKAYFKVAKMYHPDRHFDPEMSDMKEVLETLFNRIHEAYETLSSPEKRTKYTTDLVQGKIKHRPAQDRQQAKKTDNKDAAIVQFNEGIKRFNQNNFWGADEAFQWAMRLDPGNAEYVFRRGLNLSRIPRRGHEAEEYYLKSIEMAPSKIDYHLELGNFYSRTGLKAKALAALRKALQLKPDSDKIKEAIKKAGG